MATIEWIGGADAVQQENRFTPGGTIESNDKFIITLTDEAGATLAITTAAGGTTVAAVTAALLTAWDAAALLAANAPFMDGITASDQTTYFKLLGNSDGTPFYATETTTESDDSPADSQTFTKTATTPAQHPNDFNTAVNWSTGAVPGNGDTVYVTNRSTYDIQYGLVQTSGSPTITLWRNYQGRPSVGTLAAAMNMKVTTFEEGVTPDDGVTKTSGAICNFKFGNTATTGRIYSTPNTGSNGRAPVQIDVDNSSSAFTVYGTSKVGFATAAVAETSTAGTLTVKERAQVTCGVGLTLTTLNPEGGMTTLNAGVTTVNYGVGKVILNGAGNITTLNVGGDVSLYSTGTVTNQYVSGSGFAHNYFGTISNAFIYGEKARIDSPSGVPLSVTYTNGVDCLQGASSSQVDFGDNVTVTPSAP